MNDILLSNAQGSLPFLTIKAIYKVGSAGVGDERGDQRPQYLQVCRVNKICAIFFCFSVFDYGSAAMCGGGMRVAFYSEWVTCEAVEGSGHAGNGRFLCFYMCMWYIW